MARIDAAASGCPRDRNSAAVCRGGRDPKSANGIRPTRRRRRPPAGRRVGDAARGTRRHERRRFSSSHEPVNFLTADPLRLITANPLFTPLRVRTAVRTRLARPITAVARIDIANSVHLLRRVNPAVAVATTAAIVPAIDAAIAAVVRAVDAIAAVVVSPGDAIAAVTTVFALRFARAKLLHRLAH